MKTSGGKKYGKKRGKSKNKEFMDAALDAFIRDQALQKWNEVVGLKDGSELGIQQAIESSSVFFEKEAYREIWLEWWKKEVIEPEKGDDLYSMIEKAIKGAVLEEREARKHQQDAALEDSSEYKEFISRQMENLLFEASGDIEEEI